MPPADAAAGAARSPSSPPTPSPAAPSVSAPEAAAAAATRPAAAAAAASPPPPTPLPASTTARTVRFANDAGDTLVGTLAVPPGATRVAVLCHGFRDSKAAPLLAEVAAALAAAGVASLRIDFRGCGDSGGEWAFGNYAEEAADVAAAVAWLRAGGGGGGGNGDGSGDDAGRRWSVDAVAGHSKGAGSVLVYAARDAFPGLVVNIAGRFHMRDGVRRRLGEERWAALWRDGAVAMPGYTVTRASVEARFALDMGRVAAGLAPQATLLTIHGDADEIIPVADAAAYAGVVPLGDRHTARILEGACHKFVDYRPVVAAAIVDAFVGRFG